ncbi:MAG TPA: hypothetical protein VFA50_18145 [Stellaceae bacterium]|nr:hypothetical protein [Stellaceae bacterium]
MNGARDDDAGGIGQRPEAGGDVDAVAEEIAVIDDDIAEIDADAQAQAAIGGDRSVEALDCALKGDGAVDGFDGIGEFGEKPVARGLDDMAAAAPDLGIDSSHERHPPWPRAKIAQSRRREEHLTASARGAACVNAVCPAPNAP